MKDKKRLVGNWSRAKYLVRIVSFSLSLSQFPLFSLPLSHVIPASREICFRAAWKSITLSRPPLFHLVVTCFSEWGGWFFQPFSFVLPLVLFGRLSPIHFKNKSLGICLRWTRLIKQSKPSLASLRGPANARLHDLHNDWSGRGWEFNLGCPCFWGVSFLILRVAAWSARPVIQSVVLFKGLN